MKIKKRIIILAIITGLLTAILTISYINSSKNQIPASMKTTEVVVATVNIEANVAITSDMLEIKELPVSSVHINSIRSINDVVGQITSEKVIAGEQIIKDRLAIGQTDTSVSFTIPENMRAIAIPVNESTGVAGYISVGDKIDIMIEDVIAGKNITTTKLQNIVVLQKGQNPADNFELQGLNKGLTASLTILVTPSQAEVVGYALNIGSPIVVTLRNPVDNVQVPLTEYGQNNLESWRGR
jgi:pilus assembly protein CpaB